MPCSGYCPASLQASCEIMVLYLILKPPNSLNEKQFISPSCFFSQCLVSRKLLCQSHLPGRVGDCWSAFQIVPHLHIHTVFCSHLVIFWLLLIALNSSFLSMLGHLLESVLCKKWPFCRPLMDFLLLQGTQDKLFYSKGFLSLLNP